MKENLSPILNNPYEEPRLHYDANLNGNLDYNKILQGRRPYSAHIGVAPNRVESALFSNSDIADDNPNALFINTIRNEGICVRVISQFGEESSKVLTIK